MAAADSDILEKPRHHSLAFRRLVILAELLPLERLARFLVKPSKLVQPGIEQGVPRCA